MKQFRAAIFDMDGLLIDTEVLAVKAFNEACKHFELGENPDVIVSCIGTNATLAEQIIKDGLPDGTDMPSFHHHYQSTYKRLTTEQPIPVKHGVRLLLDHLRSINMPIAVATSTKTEAAKVKLNSVDLIHYFDEIIGGDQVAHSKPRPEIYLKAASSLSVSATDCIAFEDSANGVRAGVAANMTVVQIPDLVAPSEEIIALGHIILDNLEQVITHNF